jgi:drug/metabolite transporter (DMT)-like permease
VRMGVTALFWGSSFLWIKVALGGLDPVQIAFARLALGGLTLLGLCLVTRTPLPRGRAVWLRLLVPAVLGNAVPFVLFGIGEQRIDSGMAGVLNATTPLWALLIALAAGTERGLGGRRIGGLLLGFAGVVLIFAPWRTGVSSVLGALACVLASVCYAVSFTFIGRELSGRVSPVQLSTAQVGLAAVLTALALPVAGRSPVQLTPGIAAGLLVLGVCGTGVAYLLNNRVIADEGATTAATVTYLVPVVSVLLGTLVLGEPLTPRIGAGAVVVLAGVWLSGRRAGQTSRRSVAQRDSS